MKKYIQIGLLFVFTLVLCGTFSTAYAATPSLSLSAQNNTVLINVSGDANSAVNFYYTTSSGTQVRTIGTTNYAGSFSITVNSGDYALIVPGSSVYVIVNSQQSLSVVWPSAASGLSLSQTTVTTSIGQYATVTAYNNTYPLVISSNSNGSVASATTSGNTVSIYGVTNGTSLITVCTTNVAICGSISVTVGSGGGSGSLTLSQNSISLVQAGTITITAYSTSGILTISSNSNPSIASATISGNAISVYGITPGSTSISVCQNGYPYSCASLAVTVTNSSYYYTNNNQSFNLSTIQLPVGGSATISSINAGTVSISSNSNPYIASATISYLTAGCTAGALYSTTTGQLCISSSGSSVIISALTPGTTTLSVCSQNGLSNCSSIYITVTGSSVIYPLQPLQPQQPTNPTVTSCSFWSRLYEGMTGNDVYCLQLHLYAKGYLTTNNLRAVFDNATTQAVMSFQRDNGLYADGIVGSLTRARILQ